MPDWFRAYNEALDDPKVQRLPDVLFKTWFNLLCVASRCEGELPEIADLAFMLRLPEAETRRRVDELVDVGLIDREDEALRPHNWSGRQYESDNSTARVQKFRNKRRGGEVKRFNAVSETPPESETDTDTDTDIHPPPPARGREKSDWGGIVNVVPLRAGDPFEAECRVLASGLRLAEDKDFSALAELVGSGAATREDALAAIEDGRAAEPSCPRRWAKIADWARRKARKRLAQAGASKPAATARGGLAVCVELAGGEAPSWLARPPPDAVAARALARCRPGLSQSGGRVEIEAASAPSAAERAALMARRLALDGALTAAGRAAARREAARLFVAIPDGRPGPEETRAQIEAIAAALERLPGFGIAEACAGLIAAGAKYRPGAGDLAKAARRSCEPLWIEAQRIGELLGATVQAARPSAEARARAVADYRARARVEIREGAA